MAFMLIIAGALLALGGLASLFSGFDHMTTERGAAATIAGVTAISGGLITISLGFVVARLTQILAASETEEAEQTKETAITPAVVLPNVEESKPPVANMSPDEAIALKDERDTLLLNPLGRRLENAEPKSEITEKTSSASSLLKRLSLGKATAAAGTVAAGAVAAGALLSSAKQDDAETKDVAQKDAEQSEASVDALDAADIEAELASMQDQSPADKAKQLEDELASALEEEINPPSKTTVVQPAEAAEPEAVDIEPDPAPAAKPARGRRKFSEMLESKAAKAEKAPEIEEGVVDETTSPEATVAALEDAEPADPTGATETVASKEKDEEQEAPVADQPAVLGRYVRDGHTYTLYADGSVEALTETGVKKYSSMEELRRELSKV